jgi:hypothetical protein
MSAKKSDGSLDLMEPIELFTEDADFFIEDYRAYLINYLFIYIFEKNFEVPEKE